MNRRKKSDLACLFVGGAMLLLILLGILVFDGGAHLRAGRAMHQQTSTELSTEQFWQMLPG